MKLWTRFKICIFVIFYNIVYFKRYSIHCGRIGNRVELSRKEYGNNHKFFIAYPLKTIKL